MCPRGGSEAQPEPCRELLDRVLQLGAAKRASRASPLAHSPGGPRRAPRVGHSSVGHFEASGTFTTDPLFLNNAGILSSQLPGRVPGDAAARGNLCFFLLVLQYSGLPTSDSRGIRMELLSKVSIDILFWFRKQFLHDITSAVGKCALEKVRKLPPEPFRELLGRVLQDAAAKAPM